MKEIKDGPSDAKAMEGREAERIVETVRSGETVWLDKDGTQIKKDDTDRVSHAKAQRREEKKK